LIAFVVASLTGIAGARAELAAEDNDYDTKGLFELGGNVGMDWNKDLFTLDLSPSLGYFVMDNVELTGFLRFDYENVAVAGDRVTTKRGSLVIEPSYHFDIYSETLFAFAGLGIGAGYDGQHPDFELIPRVGLNIEVGRSGVLTPALRFPLLFGRNIGPDNHSGMLAGFAIEAGFTTTL
jgi:hypothetical protein